MSAAEQTFEIARRHAMAMSEASRDLGNSRPGDAVPLAATMGAAINLGMMVSALIDLQIVAPGAAGTLMRTLCQMAEDTAAELVGIGKS